MLDDVARGDAQAVNQLLHTTYEELRSIAARHMQREYAGHTMQATALVNEAYLKLIDQNRVQWQGRAHFVAVASMAMRRVLIDYARGKNRHKRGGAWRKIALDDATLFDTSTPIDLETLHQALEDLSAFDERLTQVVQLRVLGGLTTREIAVALDMAERTVERDWATGRAWLRRELRDDDGHDA